MLRLPLAEASVKLRAAGADSEPDDGESREVWAGVLPLGTAAGEPGDPDPDVPAGVPVPASLDRARSRTGTPAPTADRSSRPGAFSPFSSVTAPLLRNDPGRESRQQQRASRGSAE